MVTMFMLFVAGQIIVAYRRSRQTAAIPKAV
jgi:hypothetical protein